MDNREDILDALNEFSRKQPKEIPPLLEQFLTQIAKTGETLFPWNVLKTLFIAKLEQVITEFGGEYVVDELPACPNVDNIRFDVYRSRIMSTVCRFHGAPFTIQRLCELVTEPRRHYQQCNKFMRGVEKNIMVVSTVDPFGRKVVSESKGLVNGMDPASQYGDLTLLAQPVGHHPTHWICPPQAPSWTANADIILPSSPALLEVSDLPGVSRNIIHMVSTAPHSQSSNEHPPAVSIAEVVGPQSSSTPGMPAVVNSTNNVPSVPTNTSHHVTDGRSGWFRENVTPGDDLCPTTSENTPLLVRERNEVVGGSTSSHDGVEASSPPSSPQQCSAKDVGPRPGVTMAGVGAHAATAARRHFSTVWSAGATSAVAGEQPAVRRQVGLCPPVAACVGEATGTCGDGFREMPSPTALARCSLPASSDNSSLGSGRHHSPTTTLAIKSDTSSFPTDEADATGPHDPVDSARSSLISGVPSCDRHSLLRLNDSDVFADNTVTGSVVRSPQSDATFLCPCTSNATSSAVESASPATHGDPLFVLNEAVSGVECYVSKSASVDLRVKLESPEGCEMQLKASELSSGVDIAACQRQVPLPVNHSASVLGISGAIETGTGMPGLDEPMPAGHNTASVPSDEEPQLVACHTLHEESYLSGQPSRVPEASGDGNVGDNSANCSSSQMCSGYAISSTVSVECSGVESMDTCPPPAPPSDSNTIIDATDSSDMVPTD